MKILLNFLVLLSTVFALNIAIASEDIFGTWQGKLIPAPGTEITIQFIISRAADGAYGVVLNSPEEGGIKNIEANKVTYDAGVLKLDVTELSGSYEGVVKDGVIEGEWEQQGTSMPLSMRPYEKPALSAEDRGKLLGEWHGDIEIPNGSLTMVLRFEMTKDGELAGYLDSPDQNVSGIPVTDIEGGDGKIILKVSSIRAEITGTLAGNEIIGEYKQGPEPLPLILKKGKYIPPMDEFNLSEEDRAHLSGEWYGPLNTPATPVSPAGALAIVARFETTKDGQFKGYTDSPDQGGYDIPITSLEVNGSDIVFKVRSLFSEFSGTLSENTMVGEHKQGPALLPLTLKKGKYVAPVHSLDLPVEAAKRLSGKWKGQLGPLSMVFRFETSDTGDFVAFLDIPNQKSKDIPITEASFSDGELSLKVQGIFSEFKGQLSENELAGEWIQAGRSNPLTLVKE